jgi:adenylate cyclase
MFFKRKAYYLIIGFFSFTFTIISGQDQKVADSLVVLYNSGLYQDEEVVILLNIAINEMNPDRRLQFSQKLIERASKDSLFDFLHKGYLEKGNALRDKGNFALALESYFKSINNASRNGDSLGVGKLSISIADVYSEIGNSNNAEIYYNKGIQILRKTDDNVSLANALLNAGDEAFNVKKYETALEYFAESGIIYANNNYQVGTAYNKGNIGMVYAEQGRDVLAESNINLAIAILEELQDYYPITVYLTYMSDIYLRKKDFPTALSYAQKSLELATIYGLKEQISEANLKLSELYDRKGNQVLSYKYYKDHITFRDSVKNLESVQEMADLRTNYEVSQNQIKADYEISQKQIEVNLLNKQKKTQRIAVIASAIALFLIGLLAIGLFRRNKFIEKTKKVIEEEKDRSDNLLLNILPEETAKELKDNGKVKAKKYNAVSVLFSDFKGFTSYSKNLSPEALVETINFYFSKFDEIIEKYGLEKIKTIGDAYMCAGGLNYNNEDHSQKMLLAAFEIAAFVEKTKQDGTASKLNFDIRIGINTGPVVAGVVGTKKFAYDIWGDTVNVASRMESMSEPGRINISENTYKIIKNTWACEYRGEIEAKNRGAMKMYFVNGLKGNK